MRVAAVEQSPALAEPGGFLRIFFIDPWVLNFLVLLAKLAASTPSASTKYAVSRLELQLLIFPP